MRKIIEALTVFDWITPVVGFIEDAINDPHPLQLHSWTFFVPYDQALGNGWNAAMVEKLLDQYGIHHWGSQITSGKFFFKVPLEYARVVEYLLADSGVPVDSRSLGTPEAGTEKMPGPIEVIRDIFGL